ncbi:MAG: hypothetical protein HY303_09845 [Candidatus Wallbacteria bacterium]|nr:hypothetical protein [Candidatus Wallbacteria bacterium]
MGLDIRIPIGAMFGTLGLLLTGYGVFADPVLNTRPLGVNVNLWWGLVLLAFGAGMLHFGRKRSA